MMIERDIGKDEKKLSPKRWKRRKALESVVCLDFWVIHFLLFFLTLCPIQLLQYDIFHGRGGMREDSRWMNRIMGWSQMVEMEAPGGGDAWSWQKNFVKNSTREKDFLLLVCPEHFSCSGIFFYFVFFFVHLSTNCPILLFTLENSLSKMFCIFEGGRMNLKIGEKVWEFVQDKRVE